ncbi:hypothetical protein H7U34_04445 [Collinsella tanakaei]|nr:hypothetical protein [Collinsella tanakaei]
MPVTALQAILQAAAIFLLLLKFILQRVSIKGWTLAAVLVLIGFISWRTSKEGWLFWLAIFVTCAQGVRLKPLACTCLITATSFTLVTVIFASYNIIENIVSVRLDIVRYAMGFSQPNNFGIFLLLICISLSVLRFGKNPLLDIIVISAAVLVNLLIADSRSMAVLAILQAVVLVIFYNVNSSHCRRIASIGFVILAVMLFITSIYFMIYYNGNNAIHYTINRLLSGRLNLAHEYYQMQPLTLFGSSFEEFPPIYWQDGQPYTFVVDNAWCHVILRYGIVPSACLLLGICLLFWKMIKNLEWDALLFGMTLMMVYGFSETLGIRFECNYFLYAIGAKLLFPETTVNELKSMYNS